MIKALLFVLMMFTGMSATARTWSADDIPMVHLQDRYRYVCDPEGLLSQAARDSSDSYLYRLERDCGIQSVFVVVKKVKNGDCFRMAQDIGNRYGVGDKKTRRGLVVVIAVDDRQYFIAPGKGLEEDLTDIECDDIAQACIVRNMKKSDLDAAVFTTTKAVYSKFKTGKTGIDNSEEDDMSVGSILFICLICFGLPLLIYYFSRHNGRGPGNHNRGSGFIPPIFFFGGGSGNHHFDGGDMGGGSFGGGSFGGGGSGGSW